MLVTKVTSIKRKETENAAGKKRENLLYKPTEEPKQLPPITVTYNQTLPNIKSIVGKTLSYVTGQF